MATNKSGGERGLEASLTVPDALSIRGFNRLAALAHQVIGGDYAFISLTIGERHCFKTDPLATPEHVHRFCAATLRAGEVIWIEDSWTDCRFEKAGDAEDPDIRFYAGAPLRVDGRFIGVVAAVGQSPKPFGGEAAKGLASIAELVAEQVELQRSTSNARVAEAILHAATDAVVCADSAGSITYWNPAAEAMFGYSTDEAISSPLSMLVPKHARTKHETDFGRLMLGGAQELLGEVVRLPVRRRDGLEFLIAASFAHWKDRDGLGVGAIIRDRTARQRKDEALRRTRIMLQTVIDNMPSMVLVKDAADLRYVMANRASLNVIGRTPEAIIGRTDYDLFSKVEADGFTCADRQVLHSGEPMTIEVETISTAALGIRRLHTTKVALMDADGKPEYLLAVVHDVTEQHRSLEILAEAREAAEAANQAKSEFLANMSHEIRTPLNGVVAVADMLARADLKPKEREMAEIIRASGDTLQRLLGDILDVARIESGKVAIEEAPFHVGEMARSAAALLRLRCDEKGIGLVVDVAPEIDTFVDGDVLRVRQVVTNLLSNAVKFTDRGEVRLQVDVAGQGRVRFTVADTGVGFPMSAKNKVLGRFEQADSSITRRFGGTGLGLAICCGLAELMGGQVDCDSELGVGSRFWMELPLTPAEMTPAAVRREEPATHGEGIRVLLADDHPTNRKVVQLMLSDTVEELTSVVDGAQAVELFENRDFDVILMDMQMPVMDGLTAIREIRRLEQTQQRRRTPIVMLTANALPEHVGGALAAGADIHLAKPFTAEALFNAISAVVAEADAAGRPGQLVGAG